MSDIIDESPVPETATLPGAAPAAGRPGRLGRLFKRTPQEPLGPNYRKLWVASEISNLGDGVRLTALPLMAAIAVPLVNNRTIAAAKAAAAE